MPTAARASTLTFTTDVVELRAGAGEVNEVRFADGTLSDTAGLTVAGQLPAGCSKPSPATVACSSWPGTLDASLGDLDDDLATWVFPLIVDGGSGADVLKGGAYDDVVRGGPGDDVIDVSWGADVAEGGTGDDWVETSVSGSYDAFFGVPTEGNDRLFGGEGSDTLVTLDDEFNVDDEFDIRTCVYTAGLVLDGGDGDDVFLGGHGDDTLIGGAGSDTADYRNHRTSDYFYPPVIARYDLSGATASGILGLRPGEFSCDEFVPAGPERDRIRSDVEILLAGDTDDVIVGNALANRLDGGEGVDRVLYTGRSTPVTVTIDASADDGAAGEHDTVGPTVEQVYGGSGDDRLTGSANPEKLVSGQGADMLTGGAGGDLLFGQDGADNVFGGAGDDRAYDGPGSDRVRGEGDDDDVFGGSGADFLYGGDADDWLHDRDEVEDGFDCGAGVDRYTADVIDRRTRCETAA